jgi:hypothetical protein
MVLRATLTRTGWIFSAHFVSCFSRVIQAGALRFCAIAYAQFRVCSWRVVSSAAAGEATALQRLAA